MANCIQCGRKLPGLTFGKKKCQWCVQYEAAQRGEEGEDAKQIVMPAPWVRQSQGGVSLTQVLLGVNVAVFCWPWPVRRLTDRNWGRIMVLSP